MVIHPPQAIRQVAEHEDRARFTLDLEFLAFHDEIEAALTSEWLDPLVSHVHIKDFDGQLCDEQTGSRRYLAPGEGTLDLDGIVDRLRRSGYQGTLSLEILAVDDDYNVDWPALHRHTDWLLNLCDEVVSSGQAPVTALPHSPNLIE